MDPIIVKLIQNSPLRRSVVSNLLMGGALYHSIYNENSYLQAGISLVAPVAYVGYHAFKNKDHIINNYLGFYSKYLK